MYSFFNFIKESIIIIFFVAFSDYKSIHFHFTSRDERNINKIIQLSHIWPKLQSIIGSNNDQIKSSLWSTVGRVTEGQ